VVVALLTAGAQVDRAERHGRTPLRVAWENGHEAVMAALRAAGAT
jgi:hypothetical protein